MYRIYHFNGTTWHYMYSFLSKTEFLDWICQNQKRKDYWNMRSAAKIADLFTGDYNNEILDNINITGEDTQCILSENMQIRKHFLRPWLITHAGKVFDPRTKEICDYINKYFSSPSSKYGMNPVSHKNTKSIYHKNKTSCKKYNTICKTKNMNAIRIASALPDEEERYYNVAAKPSERQDCEGYYIRIHRRSWKAEKIEKQWQKHKSRHKDTSKYNSFDSIFAESNI